jgi:hypothetical protein
MTEAQMADLRQWHEGVIMRYPPEIVLELREAMTKWLAGVKVKK